MNLYEKIKTMNLDEMAGFMTRLHCEECYNFFDVPWKTCNQVECWCNKANGFQTYKERLGKEIEEGKE